MKPQADSSAHARKEAMQCATNLEPIIAGKVLSLLTYHSAYVDIKGSSEEVKGYYCANKEYTGPNYNQYGYSGQVICANAQSLRATLFGIVIIVGGLLMCLV